MRDSISSFDGNIEDIVSKYINVLRYANLRLEGYGDLSIIISNVHTHLERNNPELSAEEKSYIVLLFLKLFKEDKFENIGLIINEYLIFHEKNYSNFTEEVFSATDFDHNNAFLDFFIKNCNLFENGSYNKKNDTIMYCNKIKEKKVMLLENIIKEYNVGDNVNGLRVNITEYILEYFDDIDRILPYKKLYITNDTTFEFENKKFSIFSDEKKKIVSYLTLTIDEIIDYLEKNMFVFLYTYKFGGGDNNGKPKYMVWVEKEIKS